MRIAVDLDGVCYEFDRTARYMLREYKNEELGPSTSWDSMEDAIGPELWRWLFSEGIELGLFRYGHVTRGAIVGLRALADAGHTLLVVSHRPALAVPDTLAWLAYQQLPWSEIHILSNGEAKSSVPADVLIDDRPENIRDWERAGREGILVDRSHNQDYVVPCRAKDWREVVMCVQRMAMNRERQLPSSHPCLESALKMAAGSSRRETRSPGKWTTRTKRLSSRTLISGSTDS